MLARNLCFPLIPLVIRADQAFQVTAFVSILATHAIAEARFMPWRSHQNNMFEIIVSLLLIIIGIAGLVPSDDAPDSTNRAALILMFTSFTLIWVITVAGLFFAVQYARRATIRAKERVALVQDLFQECEGIETLTKEDNKAVRDWLDYSSGMNDYDYQALKQALSFVHLFFHEDPLRKRYSYRLSERHSGAGHSPKLNETRDSLGKSPSEVEEEVTNKVEEEVTKPTDAHPCPNSQIDGKEEICKADSI
jgi:hypothetical protein